MEYAAKNLLVNSRPRDIYRKIAKVTFVLFVFFIVFGTKLPFREKAESVHDMGTSNIVNQIVFTTLFLTAFISLISKRKEVFGILMKEKLLTLFLLWCLLSVTWSQFQIVSFKRYFQIFSAVTVIMAILVHTDNISSLLKYLRIIFSLYVLISFVSVFTIPMATDGNGSWVGLATSKNHLGQASVMAALTFLLSIKGSKWYQKVSLIILMLMALVLLKGSNSSTSMLTFIIILLVWLLFWADKAFKKIGTGKALSSAILIASIAFIVSAAYLAPDMIEDFFNGMGEDTTFTGRTEIWADIGKEIDKHPLLGAGYQGFWVLNNNDLLLLYNKYIWLPQQSHNGYVDIINETGYIGFTIFVIMMISYFIHLYLLKQPEFWKWFVIPVLIINMQESTIFRPGIITGTFFIFAYLALFAEIYKQERESLND